MKLISTKHDRDSVTKAPRTNRNVKINHVIVQAIYAVYLKALKAGDRNSSFFIGQFFSYMIITVIVSTDLFNMTSINILLGYSRISVSSSSLAFERLGCQMVTMPDRGLRNGVLHIHLEK